MALTVLLLSSRLAEPKKRYEGQPFRKLVTCFKMRDSVLGGLGTCISTVQLRNACFLLCIYIRDGSTLVGIFGFKVSLLLFFRGELVGKFATFCGDA